MLGILGLLFNWLGSKPFDIIADSYKAKLASGDNAARLAADLAKQQAEIEVQQQQLQNQLIVSEEGRWWMTLPKFMIEFSVALYVVKLVYDKIIGGFTDPPGDTLAIVMQIALVGMFGSYTIVKSARVLAGRK